MLSPFVTKAERLLSAAGTQRAEFRRLGCKEIAICLITFNNFFKKVCTNDPACSSSFQANISVL